MPTPIHRVPAALLLLAGCSCGGATTSALTPGTTSAAPASTTTTTAPSSASTFTVHEWGLVRSGPGDSLSVGASGPSLPSVIDYGVVEKPVLYFHLDGEASLDVGVTVDAGEGEIRELWPALATRSTDDQGLLRAITWSARLDTSGACPFPRPDDLGAPSCEQLDPGEQCEAIALASAVASSAACVALPTTAGPSPRAPFLFYRTRTRAITVPISVAGRAGDDVQIRNDGELPLPGRLVRFRRVGSRVSAVVVAPPAPHEVVTVGHDFGSPAVARAGVTESLVSIGLTSDEAAAFLTSWDGVFFGAATEDMPTEHALEETPVEIVRAPEESILYFLPESDIDQLARLTFDPPAREVHRAMAVWTTIPTRPTP